MLLALSVPLLFVAAGDGRCEFLGDRLKPFASITEMYDSNVFRVRDREQLEALVGDRRLDDFLTIASVGTRFNYLLSMQEINLLLKRDFIRYSHYSAQDSDKDELSGDLTLRILDRLKIRVDGGYTKEPEPRADFRSAAVNEKTVEQYGISSSYEFASGIGLEAAWRRIGLAYSLPEFKANEHDIDRYSGGISYVVSPQGKIYAIYQREERKYQEGQPAGPLILKRDNTADSFRAGFSKEFSPRSSISGYVGYVERRYDELSSRDFSGMIGKADLSYALTPKVAAVINWERDIYEETYAGRIYSVNDSVGGGVVYQATEKLKGTVSHRVTWKNFRDLPGSGLPGRKDFLNDLSAGIEWTPVNRLTVNVGYQHSTRSSSESTFDFTSDSATAGISYKF